MYSRDQNNQASELAHIATKTSVMAATVCTLKQIKYYIKIVVFTEHSLEKSVSWMERKIKHIDHREPQTGMDAGVRETKAALSYFGHVVRAGGRGAWG